MTFTDKQIMPAYNNKSLKRCATEVAIGEKSYRTLSEQINREVKRIKR